MRRIKTRRENAKSSFSRLLTVMLATAVLGTSTAAAFPNQAWAGAGPLSDRVNSGYDDATWAKLTDDVIEYDEVPNLIHEFNTTMRTQWDNLDETRQDLANNLEELQSARRKASDRLDNAKDDGDLSAVINSTIQKTVLSAVVKAMSSAAVNPLSKSNLIQLEKAEKQITMYAQSAILSYDSLSKQRAVLVHMKELYDRQYALALKQQELGMATATDVLTAQKNQLTAQSNIETIDSALTQILPKICTMTGWPADATPQIASIPSVDTSKIAQMNLEEDTRKAIGNNTQLQQLRRSASANTYAGDTARLNAINESDEKMTIKMQELYNDVQAKLVAYESAKDGFESARKSADSYAKMKELGMMSETQYLGGMLSYYSKEASYENADTALRQAIETYQWAVTGLVNPD